MITKTKTKSPRPARRRVIAGSFVALAGAGVGAGALATTADAITTSTSTSVTSYVHSPRSFSTTAASCRSAAAAYRTKVANAGFTLTQAKVDSKYAVADNDCHPFSAGWSYLVSYDVPAGKKAFSGDFDSTNGNLSDLGLRVRYYTHAYSNFTTKAARDAAYAGVKKTVANGNAELYDASTFGDVPSNGTYGYTVTYVAPAGGALYPYDTFDTMALPVGPSPEGHADANKRDVVTTDSGMWRPADLALHMGEPGFLG